MGKNGGTKLCSKNNKGLLHPFCIQASFDTPINDKIEKTYPIQYEQQNRRSNKTRYTRAISREDCFRFNNVSGYKTRRLNSPNFQFKGTKLLPSSKEISTDPSPKSSTFSPRSGLYGEIGSLPSLFPHSDKASTPQIFNLVSQQSILPNDLSPVRTFNSAACLRKNIQLDGECAQRKRCSSYSLPRRFSSGKSRPGHVKRSSQHGIRSVQNIGMGYQYQQIHGKSNKTDSISGNTVEHRSWKHCFTKSQKRLSEKRFEKNCNNRAVELGRREKNVGKNQFCLIRNPSRKAPFSTNSDIGPVSTRMSSPKSISGSKNCTKRVPLVVAKLNKNKSSVPKKSSSLSNHRCFRLRLGGTSRRQITRRFMDTPADVLAYKQEGIVRRPGFNQRILGVSNGKIGSYTDGQQNSGSIRAKSRRNSIANLTKDGIRIADNGCQFEYISVGSIYPGTLQRTSGWPIQKQTISRLASIKSNNSTDFQNMGNARNRPICQQEIEDYSGLCHNGFQRSSREIHKRFQSEVGVQVSLDFSAPVSHTSSPSTPQLCTGDFPVDGSSMGEGVLAGRFKTQGNCSTFPNQESPPSSHRYVNISSSTTSSKIKIGGLEDTGWSRYISSWSEENRALLEKSWRKSTLKTYAGPWKCWLKYAKQEGFVPDNPSSTDICQYLGYLHRIKKFAPATIKVHKSVIATFMDPSKSDSTITNNALVKRMLRAIDLSRPLSNVKCIWDVNVIVDFMENIDLTTSSLFEVSRHVSLILLLASGRRIHDLTLLRISKESFRDEGSSIIFWPVFGSKTDSSTHKQSGWKLSSSENRSLDPVFWIRKLIVLSMDRRATGKNVMSLFVTTRGKAGPASRAIIAGWVKTALTEVGILSSPGSIRSAVASSRLNNEIPLDTILKQGNWKRKENVFKFYFKEVARNQNSSSSNKARELIQETFLPI